MLERKTAIFWTLAIILVLQLFITFWVSLKYVSCKNELSKTLASNEYNLGRLRDISQREFSCFKALDNQIDTTIVCTNIKGVKNSILNLLQNKDNFVLVLPESLCASCYEKLLVNLGSIEKNLFSNLQTICSKFNLMKVAVYCKDANISEPNAMVNRENVIEKLNIEKFNVPVILKVTKEGVIKSIYFMDNENIEYILKIASKY